jgi:hypothetical protein
MIEENEFNRLAIDNPTKLISWIEDGTMDFSDLTFAAEALNLTKESEIVVPCLLKLLGHIQPVVREGAVYGLEGHLNYKNTHHILRFVSIMDSSEGVRIAAKEALE